MPGVRPAESWRDWNEQSFSQSGRGVGGGVFGGVFISKFHSQSHAASHLWTYFVRCYPRRPGRGRSRTGIIARFTLNTPWRNALTPAFYFSIVSRLLRKNSWSNALHSCASTPLAM